MNRGYTGRGGEIPDSRRSGALTRWGNGAAIPDGFRRCFPVGAAVVCIERLRRLGGRPLSLDLTYLPADVDEPLLAEDLVNNDVFTLLERICGQPLGRAEVGMEAVNADPHVAAVLDLPHGGALLLVERLTHLADGRSVDLEFIRFRGDRLTMRAVLDR